MIYCSQLRATPSADCNISHIAVGLSNYLILSEALTQEQVRGVEREEAMRHLRDSLKGENRKLSNVRDALDK